jgi:hypothetical protein
LTRRDASAVAAVVLSVLALALATLALAGLSWTALPATAGGTAALGAFGVALWKWADELELRRRDQARRVYVICETVTYSQERRGVAVSDDGVVTDEGVTVEVVVTGMVVHNDSDWAVYSIVVELLPVGWDKSSTGVWNGHYRAVRAREGTTPRDFSVAGQRPDLSPDFEGLPVTGLVRGARRILFPLHGPGGLCGARSADVGSVPGGGVDPEGGKGLGLEGGAAGDDVDGAFSRLESGSPDAAEFS